MHLRYRALAWVAAICLGAPAAALTGGPLVHASAGIVRGKATGDLHVFKGLPYALPPVGSRRWKPPEAMPAWKGEHDATQFGPACYQPKSRAGSIYADDPAAMSEDCLSLNIWTRADARKAPVFVWIHGGVRNSRDVGPRFHVMSVQHFTRCRPGISRHVGPGFHGMSVQFVR